eukprot:1783315-Pleurochrysis_carterae.AAC.1
MAFSSARSASRAPSTPFAASSHALSTASSCACVRGRVLRLTCFSFSTLRVYAGRAACCCARVGADSFLALFISSCVRLASSARYATNRSQSFP